MLVFALWAVWILAYPIWLGAASSGVAPTPPPWFAKLNPFVLVYSPYAKPGYVDAVDVAVFVAVALAMSIAAVVVAIRTLRKELKAPGQRSERVEACRRWIKARIFSWWPSPSLDGNPVLWREWHHNRPSRMARLVSNLFICCTILGMAIGIVHAIHDGNYNLLVVTSFTAVTFGLLLVERDGTHDPDRGAGAGQPGRAHEHAACDARYRPRQVLGHLSPDAADARPPALAGLFVAGTCLDYPPWMPARLMHMAKPITTVDRVRAGILPTAFFLVHSAVVTSFGLALATWFKRTGRAVAISVAVFVVMSIGWIVAVEAAVRPLLNWWQMQGGWLDAEKNSALTQSLIALSPMGGQVAPFDALTNHWNRPRDLSWQLLLIELVFVAVVAVVFLGLTLLTFNRCMGRMNESPDMHSYLRDAKFGLRQASGVKPRVANQFSTKAIEARDMRMPYCSLRTLMIAVAVVDVDLSNFPSDLQRLTSFVRHVADRICTSAQELRNLGGEDQDDGVEVEDAEQNIRQPGRALSPGVVDTGLGPRLRRNSPVGLDRGHGMEEGRGFVLPDEPGGGADAALALDGDADEHGIPESGPLRVDLCGDRSVGDDTYVDGACCRVA